MALATNSPSQLPPYLPNKKVTNGVPGMPGCHQPQAPDHREIYARDEARPGHGEDTNSSAYCETSR